MKMKLALAAVALLTASTSQAAITVYTNIAAFNAATSAPGTDTYTGFSITGTTASPITRTAGAYTYTAAASTSTFFGAGTTANPWLSTNIASDSITFSGFTSTVRGIGGNFFGSDIGGAFAAGNITLSVTDGSGTTTQTIAGATTSSFLGFVSTGPITNMVVTSVQGQSPLWPTVDNLVLAQGRMETAVPEPATWMMMIGGFGLVGASMRRRAARTLATA